MEELLDSFGLASTIESAQLDNLGLISTVESVQLDSFGLASSVGFRTEMVTVGVEKTPLGSFVLFFSSYVDE